MEKDTSKSEDTEKGRTNQDFNTPPSEQITITSIHGNHQSLVNIESIKNNLSKASKYPKEGHADGSASSQLNLSIQNVSTTFESAKYSSTTNSSPISSSEVSNSAQSYEWKSPDQIETSVKEKLREEEESVINVSAKPRNSSQNKTSNISWKTGFDSDEEVDPTDSYEPDVNLEHLKRSVKAPINGNTDPHKRQSPVATKKEVKTSNESLLAQLNITKDSYDKHITKLSESDISFDLIKKYVVNSISTKNDISSLKIYSVKMPKGISLFSFSSSKKSSYKMLLWYVGVSYKVAGTIVENGLKLQKSGRFGYKFLAFYDRIPLKETSFSNSSNDKVYFLCEVNLGKVHKSPHGYEQWSKCGLPSGSDSVKGNGEYIPDWKDNVTIAEGTIVPIGETKLNQRFQSYQLTHNEYIIFDEKQVSLKFMVVVK